MYEKISLFQIQILIILHSQFGKRFIHTSLFLWIKTEQLKQPEYAQI
jgi:predicted XRE-type DNA-binding protein